MLEIRPFMVALLGLEEVDVVRARENCSENPSSYYVVFVQEALKKDIFLPASAKLFRYMKKFLDDNNSGYLVGDSLTWADLYLAEHVAVYGQWFPEMLEGFPEIKSHTEKVRSNPALRKWIETRPETKF
ncbi:glutathione S-transferase protein [Ancylostoma duodenale]|uniref:glutathione transferase n=1 Tax=Ancylostoma duodenale TaxID=51022 RepID=A0A0C2C317_9BILA|nr:glutathione S-transferase protein [Ancylostoma duodenale]